MATAMQSTDAVCREGLSFKRIFERAVEEKDDSGLKSLVNLLLAKALEPHERHNPIGQAVCEARARFAIEHLPLIPVECEKTQFFLYSSVALGVLSWGNNELFSCCVEVLSNCPSEESQKTASNAFRTQLEGWPHNPLLQVVRFVNYLKPSKQNEEILRTAAKAVGRYAYPSDLVWVAQILDVVGTNRTKEERQLVNEHCVQYCAKMADLARRVSSLHAYLDKSISVPKVLPDLSVEFVWIEPEKTFVRGGYDPEKTLKAWIPAIKKWSQQNNRDFPLILKVVIHPDDAKPTKENSRIVSVTVE